MNLRQESLAAEFGGGFGGESAAKLGWSARYNAHRSGRLTLRADSNRVTGLLIEKNQRHPSKDRRGILVRLTA